MNNGSDTRVPVKARNGEETGVGIAETGAGTAVQAGIDTATMNPIETETASKREISAAERGRRTTLTIKIDERGQTSRRKEVRGANILFDYSQVIIESRQDIIGRYH